MSTTTAWVRVTDSLPTESSRVIAIYRGVYDHRIVTFWRDSGGTPHFGHPGDSDGKGSQPATHWHPLPDLPRCECGRGGDEAWNADEGVGLDG